MPKALQGHVAFHLPPHYPAASLPALLLAALVFYLYRLNLTSFMDVCGVAQVWHLLFHSLCVHGQCSMPEDCEQGGHSWPESQTIAARSQHDSQMTDQVAEVKSFLSSTIIKCLMQGWIFISTSPPPLIVSQMI